MKSLFCKSILSRATLLPRIKNSDFIKTITEKDEKNSTLILYLKSEIQKAKLSLVTNSDFVSKPYLKSLLDGDVEILDKLNDKMKVKDAKFWIILFFELGRLSFEKNDFEKCLKVWKYSLDLLVPLYNENDNNVEMKNWMVYLLIYLGQTAYFSDKHEESIEYYNQALKLKTLWKEDKDVISGHCYVAIAQARVMLKNVDLVENHEATIMKILKDNPKSDELSTLHVNWLLIQCQKSLLEFEMGGDGFVPDPKVLKEAYQNAIQGAEIATEYHLHEKLIEFLFYRAHMQIFGREFDKSLNTLKEAKIKYESTISDQTSLSVFKFKDYEMRLTLYRLKQDGLGLLEVLEGYLEFIVKTRINEDAYDEVKESLTEVYGVMLREEKVTVEQVDLTISKLDQLEISSLELKKLVIDILFERSSRQTFEQCLLRIEKFKQEILTQKDQMGSLYPELLVDLKRIEDGCEIGLGIQQAKKKSEKDTGFCTIL